MLNIPERVKDAIKKGNTKKNVRVVVYTADGSAVDFTIDNDNLISESLVMDERMCSEDNIKFGLCEGTKLEFQCFDKPNIKGRRIQAFVDVKYTDEEGEEATYSIPLGWYDVKEASRQASTGIMKYTCYNKLLSEYLDNKANDGIVEAAIEGDTGTTGQITISEALYRLLDGYAIEPETTVYVSATDDASASFIMAQQQTPICRQSGGMYLWMDGAVATQTAPEGHKTFMWTANIKWTPSALTQTQIDHINDLGTHCKLSFNPKCFFDGVNAYNKKDYNAGIGILNGGTFKTIISYLSTYYDDSTDIPAQAVNNKLYGLCFGSYNEAKSVYSAIDIYPNKTKEYAESGYFTKIENSPSDPQVFLRIPLHTLGYDQAYYNSHSADYQQFISDATAEIATTFKNYIRNYSRQHSRGENYNFDFQVLERADSPIAQRILTTAQAQELPGVTLRQLQTAAFEMDCKFGRLDRVKDLFGGQELNQGRLYPANDLYPADDLYPMGTSERTTKSMYSKLWADEGNVHTFRNLIITYKTTENNQEVDKTVEYEVNAGGTDDYVISDNWLLRNLVWTDAQIGEYAEAMVTKMQPLSWFPFDMDCVGLPYIETGDELEIKINNETYTSYVLTRNMKGIQSLQDNMKNGELNIF